MQRNNLTLIAIDGPAGAGKTTVAESISNKLGILYLNTGAMYRAAGLHALRLNIDPLCEKDVLTFLNSLNIDVEYKNKKQKTLLNGEDVSALISDEAVSEAASKISSLPSVRVKMVHLQQQLATKQSLIIDGRDIGTVVLPNATHKFYLDAKVEERAKRRYKQYLKSGNTKESYEEILKDIKERDYRDMNREYSPLKLAEDAHYIDSTNINADEVVEKIMSYFKN
jgi:CMP/dCMP kinase